MPPWLDHADPAVVANTVICLIHQANYLLDQQIAGLERQFISEGGYSERLAAARLAERGKQQAGGTSGEGRASLPGMWKSDGPAHGAQRPARRLASSGAAPATRSAKARGRSKVYSRIGRVRRR